MQLTHIRDLLVEAPLSSGHAFLSAASGMVMHDNQLCVVADDAHCLALFSLDAAEPGQLIRLIDGDLPRDKTLRKKAKPDFEILLALPGTAGDRLLAIGSGSTTQRMRGAIIDRPSSGAPMTVRLINLQPLFAALAPLVPEINLEGAVLCEDRLLLFNRGNMQFPASHILSASLADVMASGPVLAVLCAKLDVPQVSGVPLTITDACRLENGHFLLSAVAEATSDSYADGALVGAAIVELDASFNVCTVEPIEPVLKIEGIVAGTSNGALHLLCVTDADDPDQPSALYAGTCRWNSGQSA